MPETEKYIPLPESSVHLNNRFNYRDYKRASYAAEHYKTLMTSKSFTGLVRRAICFTYDVVTHTSAKDRNEAYKHYPDHTVEHAAGYYQENEEAVVEDAIFDFYSDSRNAGKELNLTGNDINDAANRVQAIVEQDSLELH